MAIFVLRKARMSPFAALGLGFLLGLRHATDADHVVAVSALASRERTLGRTLALGTLWGIGHTATVFVVGGAMVAFGLRVPPAVEQSFEMLVAAMLVALGVVNVVGPRSGRAAGAPAFHAARPVIVGIVHGLAGSAAVALLVLATLPEPVWALSYLAIFGVGTILGMAILTVALSLPLAAAARRFSAVDRHVARAFGLVSIAVGIGLAYRVGVVEGLLVGEALAAR